MSQSTDNRIVRIDPATTGSPMEIHYADGTVVRITYGPPQSATNAPRPVWSYGTDGRPLKWNP